MFFYLRLTTYDLCENEFNQELRISHQSCTAEVTVVQKLNQGT